MPFETSSLPKLQLKKPKNYLMWFRRDLRLHDNTALTMLFDEVNQILNEGNKYSEIHISALYSLTPKQWLEHDMSLVQLDFIFRTLKRLAYILFNDLGILLQVIHAETFDDSIKDIEQLCNSQNITHVYANIEYEVNEQNRDQTLATRLGKHNIEFNRYHDQCILPPGTVNTNDKTMYKVFTPFYKKWQSIIDASPIQVYPTPIAYKHLDNNPAKYNKGDLEQLLADINNYQQQTLEKFKSYYQLQASKVDELLTHTHADYPAGEDHAQNRLKSFIKEDITDYNIARDKPSLMATSQLSAYLSIGSLSTRQCYQQAIHLLNDENPSQTDIQTWISELAWRDFYRHVMVDRPDIVKGIAFNKSADQKVSWSYNQADFDKWREGNTGIPLVDAAMRCLNQTGFMHNRLRMVTAMFLTKDLFIDWRWGERYFMQQLIDGDFASNNGGWQWSASVGTDAAPYFRIMNPFSQAKTHDQDATFIKSWLPELKSIPAKILHDEAKLSQALSEEGDFAHIDYPKPMVKHKQARLYAIDQFKASSK